MACAAPAAAGKETPSPTCAVQQTNVACDIARVLLSVCCHHAAHGSGQCVVSLRELSKQLLSFKAQQQLTLPRVLTAGRALT